MADISVEIDTKQIIKTLDRFNKAIPGIAVKLMRAVNNEAKKKIRQEYRKRGYHATKLASWGNSGYSRNLVSFANKDYSGKIMLRDDAFYYRFLEFGTNHKTMTVYRGGTSYTIKAYSVPAKPVLYPVANSIWHTTRATELMQIQFDKEVKKLEERK